MTIYEWKHNFVMKQWANGMSLLCYVLTYEFYVIYS